MTTVRQSVVRELLASAPLILGEGAVIERLRALPEAEQEMLAGEIEDLLMEPASLLTAAQWREVEVRSSSARG